MPGHMTVAQAAVHQKVAYHVAYGFVKRNEVAHKKVGSTYYIPRAEVAKIKKREYGRDERPREHIVVQPNLERAEAWAKAAGPLSLSVWLGSLADEAASWAGGD